MFVSKEDARLASGKRVVCVSLSTLSIRTCSFV